MGLILAVGLLALPVIAGTPPLSLTLTPHVGLPGTNARVVLRIPRNAANRRVVLLWDGPISGTDDRPLDGADAPAQIVYDHALVNLPDGSYSIEGVLLQADGHSYRTSVETLQIGAPPDDGN